MTNILPLFLGLSLVIPPACNPECQCGCQRGVKCTCDCGLPCCFPDYKICERNQETASWFQWAARTEAESWEACEAVNFWTRARDARNASYTPEYRQGRVKDLVTDLSPERFYGGDWPCPMPYRAWKRE